MAFDPWDQFAEAPTTGFAAGDPENSSSPAAAPVAQASPPPAPAPAPANGNDPWSQFREAAPDASAAPSPTEVQFGDEGGTQAASRMAPEDDAAIVRMLQAGDAGSARSYAEHHGFQLPNAEQLVEFYKQHPQAGDTGAVYQLPAATSNRTQAFGDGLSQGASLGTSDEIHGALSGIGALLHGGNYSDTYDRTVDQDRAQLGADDRDYYGFSLAGNIAGGLALPLGLEKTGLTASSRAIGVAARDAAIASGVAPAAADKIAAQAIAHRLTAEGAAYGGAYGAGSSDGSPGQRLLGGAAGAAGGAFLGGVAIPAAEKALGAGARGAGRVWDAATGSFTKSGAERAAGGVLADSAMRPVEDIVNDIAKRPAPVDGVIPTLAEVAGDAGLAGLQRGVANTSKDASGPIGERFAQNAIARTAYADKSLGSGNPQAIQDVAASRLASAQGETAAQQAERAAAVEQGIANRQRVASANLGSANDAVVAGREAIGPIADADATGSQARDAFTNAYQAAKARTRHAYNDPRLLDNDPIDLRPHDLSDHYLPSQVSETPDMAAFQNQAVQGARGALPPKPQSLNQFIRARGGVDPAGMGADDLRASGLDAKGSPGFIRQGGKPLDDHLEAATEAGFVPQGTSLSDFTNHIVDEHRGAQRLVRPEDMNAAQDHETAASNRQFWDKNFAERGLNPASMTDEDWHNFYHDVSETEPQTRSLLDVEGEPKLGKPMGPFQKAMASIKDQYFGHGVTDLPPEANKFYNNMMNADTMGLRDLEGMESHARDLAARAPDNRTAAFLKGLANTIGGKASVEGGPARAEALSIARAARAEQGRVFESGDASKAFGLDRYGRPAVGDNTLPSKLVRPGAVGGDTAAGLNAAIGPDASESVVRQELRRQVEQNNVTTETQARSLATKFGEAARRFPAVKSDLVALVGHTGRLDAAASAARDAERATITAAQKAHINEMSAAEQAIKASPISRIANPAEDPASFVGSLLGRSDGGRMLARLASDVADNPDAVAGLRRSFGQYIVDAGSGVRNTASGDDIPALAKTRKAISTIITRSGDLLTPQQKIALQRVGRELKATNFAMNAGRPSGSDTAQNQSYKAALHFLPMAGPHVAGAKAVLSVIASQFTNRAQVQHLITQAILDPDLAATLLKRPTAMHLEAARTRLLGRKALISSSLIAQPSEQAAVQQMVGAK